MVHAANSAFDEAPKSLNAIRMDVAHHVHLGRVVDSPMNQASVASIRTPDVTDTLVGSPFVRIDRAIRQDVFADHGDKSRARGIRSGLGDNPAPPFAESDNGSFNFVAAKRTARTFLAASAKIGFVNLDVTAQLALLGEQRANLFEHAPCGLVGDARLAFNLLRGDSAACGSHQVDRVEPCLKRSARFMEDRPGSRVNVMAALIARVRRTASYPVMLGNALAQLAKDTIRVQVAPEPFEAGNVIREHPLEIFEGKPLHLRSLLLFQDPMLSEYVPTVKG